MNSYFPKSLPYEKRREWLNIEAAYSYHDRYPDNDKRKLLYARDCAFAKLLGKPKPRFSKNYSTDPQLFT